MERQSHLGATMASPHASIRPASSLLLGPDPIQHPGEEPRPRHRQHRKESLAANPEGARPAKPGCFQGVSSLPARDRLTFAYSKVISRRRVGKRFWLLGGLQHAPRGQINASAVRASTGGTLFYFDIYGEKVASVLGGSRDIGPKGQGEE